MILEFLTKPAVRRIIFQLKWGDRFESDLIASLDGLVEKPEIEFHMIREKLIEHNLAYKLLGGQGSPYLSLNDLGQAVVDRLYEIETMLKQGIQPILRQDEDE